MQPPGSTISSLFPPRVPAGRLPGPHVSGVTLLSLFPPPWQVPAGHHPGSQASGVLRDGTAVLRHFKRGALGGGADSAETGVGVGVDGCVVGAGLARGKCEHVWVTVDSVIRCVWWLYVNCTARTAPHSSLPAGGVGCTAYRPHGPFLSRACHPEVTREVIVHLGYQVCRCGGGGGHLVCVGSYCMNDLPSPSPQAPCQHVCAGYERLIHTPSPSLPQAPCGYVQGMNDLSPPTAPLLPLPQAPSQRVCAGYERPSHTLPLRLLGGASAWTD